MQFSTNHMWLVVDGARASQLCQAKRLSRLHVPIFSVALCVVLPRGRSAGT
jgi:hypothetical protein